MTFPRLTISLRDAVIFFFLGNITCNDHMDPTPHQTRGLLKVPGSDRGVGRLPNPTQEGRRCARRGELALHSVLNLWDRCNVTSSGIPRLFVPSVRCYLYGGIFPVLFIPFALSLIHYTTPSFRLVFRFSLSLMCVDLHPCVSFYCSLSVFGWLLISLVRGRDLAVRVSPFKIGTR